MRARTVFLWIVVGAISAAGVIGLLTAVGLVQGVEFEVLITALFVALFGAAAAVFANGIEKKQRLWVMWTGLAMDIASLVLSLLLIWDFLPNYTVDEWVEKGSLVTGVLTVFLIVVAVHGAMQHKMKQARTVGSISIVFAALTSALTIVLILGDNWDLQDSYNEFILRAMLVSAILAAAGLSLAPILERLLTERVKDSQDASFGERALVTLTCPRCQSSQRVRAGKSRCQQCGLRMQIEFDEPRCGCGYLLHGLEAECCPECGEAVPKKDRWPVAARRVTDEPLEAG